MDTVSHSVIRLDDRLDAVVDPGASVQKVLEDHSAFFEGPVWIDTPDGGHLLFTDIAGDAILRWEPNGRIHVVASSFFATTPASVARELDLGSRSVVLKGPDGLAIDREGRIVYCGYGPRHVGRLEPDGRITVLAEAFEGRRLNTPNDVVVSADGTVYFTDSSADLVSRLGDPGAGVPFSAVYWIRDGSVELLDGDFTAANGLVFSSGERHLYVNDTRRKLVWRFDVAEGGRLARRELFVDMNSDAADGVPDGMKIDARGNVYCTGPRGLWVLAEDGTHLGVIATPERLTNLAFGGPDRQTLFMTGPSYVWQIRLKVPGSSQGAGN